MNGGLQDVRYAMRQLIKTSATVVAITLALGIGVNTGIFSVLNGWLFRPLPVPAPEQIAVLAAPREDGSEFSFLDFTDVRKLADVFSGVFAYATGIAGLSTNSTPSEFAYSAVSGNYFSTLGVKPLLGRLFLPAEGEKAGDQLQVVLGYSYWRKTLSEDRGIVGWQVLLNGKPATVIGGRGRCIAHACDGQVVDGRQRCRPGDIRGGCDPAVRRGLARVLHLSAPGDRPGSNGGAAL